MNTEHLKTFLMVAQTGSFSAAQSRLFLTRQGIMQQINSLEACLCCSLLERTHRGVMLTQAGQAFLPEARAILAAEENARSVISLQAGVSRVIRLCHIDYHIMLVPVTALFQKRFPNVMIEKVFQPSVHEGDLVAEGIIDVGDAVYHPKYRRNGLRYEKMMNLPYFCLLPKALTGISSPEELRSLPIFANGREFNSHYEAHLPLLQDHFPRLTIESPEERRMDTLFRKLNDGIPVLTSAPFAKKIKGYAFLDLNLPFQKEGGVVFRTDANSDIMDYVRTAAEIYRSPASGNINLYAR